MAVRYTADFETVTDPDDCRVWAYGTCEVGSPNNFTYGNNIDDFMSFCRGSNNASFYFHNLAFDGVFLMIWLFENGFEHVKDRKELDTNKFTTLISNKGQFYSMKIVFKKQGKRTHFIELFDSLKILPMSVEAVAKGFNLPVSKLKIDYHEKREINHTITPHEIDYIRSDVEIMARALHVLFEQGLEKMTQGSNAMFDYQRTITMKRFDQWFPVPDYDYDVRLSYRGGFTYLNPIYREVDIEGGIVFDVNSLYPSVMRNKPLPYGEGIFFEGEYKKDTLYNMYTQRLTCQFELKPDHIPTIQLKNTLAFIPTEYLASSDDKEVTMSMTSVDLELFFKHYDVYNIEYINGWKFKSTIGLFTEYIDKWSEIKIQAKKDGNMGMYLLAKLMLNALYGKFALNPNVQSKNPYYDKGIIKYTDGDKETRDPIYIPVGTFVTAWARHATISAAQSVYDRFIYADTDSLHLIGTELPDGLDVDDTELGKWSHESTFVRGRFLRAKSYFETTIVSDKTFSKMEEEKQKKCHFIGGVRVIDEITCAGLPDSCHQFVTWDNFRPGAIYSGKLQKKNVVGGVILKDIDFSIKGT